MNPIETLMNEHRVIETVLDALEAYADQAGRGADPADLGRFVTFIREFADHCHHAKEERILFAGMVAAGFPQEGGPIAVMLMEHDQGRALVGELASLSRRDRPWTAAEAKQVADHARGFTALLRAHIQKEDGILYPLAQAHLSAEKMQEIADRFARVEREEIGEGAHERYHALAESLAGKYAPASLRR